MEREAPFILPCVLSFVLEVSWRVLGASWRVLEASWARLGSQNHPQHKPDLTWNGKRRSFEKIAMAALKGDYLRSILLRASIWKPLGSRAPLAALARSLRSPHTGAASILQDLGSLLGSLR